MQHNGGHEHYVRRNDPNAYYPNYSNTANFPQRHDNDSVQHSNYHPSMSSSIQGSPPQMDRSYYRPYPPSNYPEYRPGPSFTPEYRSHNPHYYPPGNLPPYPNQRPPWSNYPPQYNQSYSGGYENYPSNSMLYCGSVNEGYNPNMHARESHDMISEEDMIDHHGKGSHMDKDVYKVPPGGEYSQNAKEVRRYQNQSSSTDSDSTSDLIHGSQYKKKANVVIDDETKSVYRDIYLQNMKSMLQNRDTFLNRKCEWAYYD